MPLETVSAERSSHVLLSEVDGKAAVCFDTGLEPRSFARTKMSGSLTEKGFIVKPDASSGGAGSYEAWMPHGVCELNGRMRVWGKPPSCSIGERFDKIMEKVDNSEEAKQAALTALVHWIKAKMILKDETTPANIAASFVNSDGSVFFSPPLLADRCLFAEGINIDQYNCPDLSGIDAVAFCAGAILYKIFTNTMPFVSDESIFQNMREGVFIPAHLAAPGLHNDMCKLIHYAFSLPVKKKNTEKKKSEDIICGMLNLLVDEDKNIIPKASFFTNLSSEENQRMEKEKKNFTAKQNTVIKFNRFIIKNKIPVIITAIAAVFVLFVVINIVSGMRRRPSTEGMTPDSVVQAYYNAYSSLDHFFMEACTQGSDPVIKNDINGAAAFYALVKTRESYENRGSPIISARLWKEAGGELPAPNVFGVTDLKLEFLSGDETYDMLIYRANYNLWSPDEMAVQRTDTLTLKKDRRQNWRITEIIRVER